MSEAQKKYYYNNKEKCATASKKWREANKEHVKVTSRLYWENHREQQREYQKNFRDKLRLDVLNFYSNNAPKCARCGIDDMDVLCIDHIENNGSRQRKELFGDSRQGNQMYWWLRKNGFPVGYQVFCWNCNHKKQVENLRNDKEK